MSVPVRDREARAKVERLWAAGASVYEIADAMGWALATVRPTLTRYRQQGCDLPYRKNGAVRARIIKLWGEGATAGEIARLIGWTAPSVTTTISRLRAQGFDLPYRRAVA